MSVRVVFHYGGTFVKEPIIDYVGGSVEIIENVELDKIFLTGIHEFHSQLNPIPHVDIYYFVPSYKLWEGGTLILSNDTDVCEMVDVLVNNESEEVVLYAEQMEGPIQVVGKGKESE